MKILFSLCSWGMGHATRDIPLIGKMLDDGHEVTIAAYGRSLELLKRTLQDRCEYIELFDYPSPYTRSSFMIGKIMLYFPKILRAIKEEHRKASKIIHEGKFDRVISDARYGVYSKSVPSFFMAHQIRYIVPGRIFLGEVATELFNHNFHKKFGTIIIPDYEKDSLSGDLSHNLRFKEGKRIEYIGIITDLKRKDVKQDVDYFISMSGPEPPRTVLEKKILSQIGQLDGRIVMARGRPETMGIDKLENVEMHEFLDRHEQENIMNRSRMIITRSGYTTMMELVALRKKALLIPTPGQTEQEYLSAYHNGLGTFYSVKQSKLSLGRDVEIAEKYSGFREQHSTEESVEKFMQIVS